jgi:hypothetical protein
MKLPTGRLDKIAKIINARADLGMDCRVFADGPGVRDEIEAWEKQSREGGYSETLAILIVTASSLPAEDQSDTQAPKEGSASV